MKMPMTMMFTSQLFAYIQSRTPAQALGDVVGFEHRQGCEDEDRAVAGCRHSFGKALPGPTL